MSYGRECATRAHKRLRACILLAGALTAVQGVPYAQSEGRTYRIGILTETRAENARKYWEDTLRELGYVEGKNATFEVRGAAEEFALLPKLATELVQSKVDIILTASTPPAVAAKQVTSTIPIVTLSADPVGAALVRTLAHPGGNVTGVYVPLVDMAAKRLQLLKEAVPGLTSIAIIWNPLNPAARLQAKATEDAAHALRLTTFSVEVANQTNLDEALQLLYAKRPSGFIVMNDPVLFVAAGKLAQFAIQSHLPAFHPYRAFAEAGGLMSYGINLKALFEAGAIYADKILKGARPADLPMEQPSRYEFVINLKTAKQLGITIPESILLRADELIR